jgi:hypothetical protein
VLNGLELWRNRWLAAGLPVIPIEANHKTPLFAWQSMPSNAQWFAAGGNQFRGNIATILGNSYVVIDTDDQPAVEHIGSWLDGKGISTSQVRTPSGGVHYWLRVAHAPAEVNCRHLSPDIGKGELRVANCYVLAPCSVIGNERYRFEVGSPEQIAAMRVVKWQDLLELLPGGYHGQGDALSNLPVRLLKREMPPRAAYLFAMLRDAPKGKPVERYSSCSEAEAAIIAMLVLSGWELSEIASAFDAEQPAHYAEHKQGKQYLKITYRNVLGDIASTPERAQIAELYHQASEQAWQGKSGLLNLAVLRAVIAIGYQYATYTPNASERDIAEHASASDGGAHNALKRLCADGYLRRVQPGENKSMRGALWQIIPSRFVSISHSVRGIASNAQAKQIAEDYSMDGVVDISISNNKIDADIAEMWGQSCLGRSSYAVYLKLLRDGKSIREIADQTGKSWHTVRDALKRLQLHDLADQRDGLWVVGGARAPSVADDFEAHRLAERRHDRHEHEREAWRLRVSRSA